MVASGGGSSVFNWGINGAGSAVRTFNVNLNDGNGGSAPITNWYSNDGLAGHTSLQVGSVITWSNGESMVVSRMNGNWVAGWFFDEPVTPGTRYFVAAEDATTTFTAAHLLANDSDETALSIAAVTADVIDLANNSVIGTATLSGGNIQFAANSTLQSSLTSGNFVNAVLSYQVADSFGGQSASTLTFQVFGVV